MAVPGFKGEASYTSWLSAGLFDGFEVWTCDAYFPSGDITFGDRMAETATNIANAIRAGEAPTPDVLFGFSAAGYMAWLVGFILGGEHRKIIIADAAPVHRVGYRQVHTTFAAQNQNLIGLAKSPSRPGTILLIRRATSDRFKIPGNERIIWSESDGLAVTIEVTALDHMEMDEPEIYSIVAPHVRAFNDGSELPKHIKIHQNLTFGGKIWSLIESDDCSDHDLLKTLLNEPLDIRWRVALGGLLYLALQHSNVNSTLNFIKEINRKKSNFRDFLYAEFLIEKINPHFGAPKASNQQIPVLGSQQSVDAAFGSSGRNYLKFLFVRSIFVVYMVLRGAITKRQLFQFFARNIISRKRQKQNFSLRHLTPKHYSQRVDL